MRSSTLLSTAAILASALTPFCTVHAQSAGQQQIGIGLAHIRPNSDSGPLTVTRIGATPVNVEQRGVGSRATNMTTLSLTYEYWLTNNWSGELFLGIPPSEKLKGTEGLSQFGQLGKARLYQPAIVAKYTFGPPTQTWRPMVGLGVSYVWFGNAKITNSAFQQAVMHGDTDIKLSKQLAPVLTTGLSYRVDDRWSIAGLVAWVPFSVKAKLHSAAMDAETKLKINTLYIGAGLKYSF